MKNVFCNRSLRYVSTLRKKVFFNHINKGCFFLDLKILRFLHFCSNWFERGRFTGLEQNISKPCFALEGLSVYLPYERKIFSKAAVKFFSL